MSYGMGASYADVNAPWYCGSPFEFGSLAEHCNLLRNAGSYPAPSSPALTPPPNWNVPGALLDPGLTAPSQSAWQHTMDNVPIPGDLVGPEDNHCTVPFASWIYSDCTGAGANTMLWVLGGVAGVLFLTTIMRRR